MKSQQNQTNNGQFHLATLPAFGPSKPATSAISTLQNDAKSPVHHEGQVFESRKRLLATTPHGEQSHVKNEALSLKDKLLDYNMR